MADQLGFIKASDVNAVGEAVLTTQRDHGDRTNRKHARLKYTIEDRGLAWFRAEVERRSGVAFGSPRSFSFTSIQDPFGWQRCADGSWFYGLHILSGRIRDADGWLMKSALREIAGIHEGDFRLTPSQNLTISGVTDQKKPLIDSIFAQSWFGLRECPVGIYAAQRVVLRCPANLQDKALAESERALPEFLERFETILEQLGLKHNAISLRITGCPNGCARPYLAEIGFVGRAPGKYALYLGASYQGTRLNRLFAQRDVGRCGGTFGACAETLRHGTTR